MNDCKKIARVSGDKHDRINGLPDELLQHILSFLGTREVVQKGLVCKRWVNLWTSVPCINIDQKEFVNIGSESPPPYVVRIMLYKKFKEFAVRVLSGREASFLDKLLIRFPDNIDKFSYSAIFRKLVRSGTKFSPRVLSMKCFLPTKNLLAWIFTCESIEAIFLAPSCDNLGYIRVVPKIVNLPYIRRLQLEQITLDKRSIAVLFSGCPVLEELLLDWCDVEFSSILSQKLKYLSLRDCQWEHLDHCNVTISVKPSILGDIVESVINRCHPVNLTVKFIWKTPCASGVNNTLPFVQNVIHRLCFGDPRRSLSSVIEDILRCRKKRYGWLESSVSSRI